MDSSGGRAWKWLKPSGHVYVGRGKNKGSQVAGSIFLKGQPLIKEVNSVFLDGKGKARSFGDLSWNHLAEEVAGT